MTAPTNRNTQNLPAAKRDAGNNVTETVFLRRRNGRDEIASSRDMLASKQPKPDVVVPPSHRPGTRTPNQSPEAKR